MTQDPKHTQAGENYRCQTCGKTVKPRLGKLSCCGITETLKYARKENARHSRVVTKEITKQLYGAGIFQEVVSHWNDDDGDFTDYEGIPNT